MLPKITSSSALTVYIPPAIYVAGSTIEGEVAIDFRQLQEENIEEVQIRLRGSSSTSIHRNQSTIYENIRLVREDSSLWCRGGAYPPPGEDTLRVPFSFQLPEQLPPSFHYRVFDKSANVRYSLTAVGVRKGILNFNKRERVPLAILPRDEPGAQLKAQNATHGWKTYSKEDRIRKGLWGDYAKVQVELSLPDIQVLPLFSDIPYIISIVTATAPLSRSRADDHPANKPIFPPVPQSCNELEFNLHRKLRLRVKMLSGGVSTNAATFLGRKKPDNASQAPVESEVPEKEWAPLQGLVGDEKGGKDDDASNGDRKGSWVQRATFRSTFHLTCPPTFAVHNIHCNYELVVKVPFPGLGNSLKLEVPVTVTSGIDKPLPREQSDSDGPPPPTLDLPPSYWDADDREWGADDKE